MSGKKVTKIKELRENKLFEKAGLKFDFNKSIFLRF